MTLWIGSTSTDIFPKIPDELQQIQMEYNRIICYEAVSNLTRSSSSPVHETVVCLYWAIGQSDFRIQRKCQTFSKFSKRQ